MEKRPTGHIIGVKGNPNMKVQPKKGDIVTFEFETASRREIPTNPTITRIRKDVSWDDVVRDHAKSSNNAIPSMQPFLLFSLTPTLSHFVVSFLCFFFFFFLFFLIFSYILLLFLYIKIKKEYFPRCREGIGK